MDPVVLEWAGALRASDRSEDTVRVYTEAVSLCARHAGKRPLELTSADVSVWLGRPGLSRNTRAAYYRRLRAWRRWCKRTKRGKLRLLHGIDPVKGEKTPPKPVSEGNLAALLLACRDDEERMMIRLAAWMGLRRAEICKVEGDDYDPDAQTLRVTGKGRKTVVLPVPPVVADLAERMPRSGPWFRAPGGGHLTRTGMAFRMAALAERAGCPEVTLHQLRHRFATRLVKAGVQMFVVQQLMRHSSSVTTEGYALIDPQQMADAIARLPEAA